DIFFIWEYPYLEKFHLLVWVVVVFRMHDTGACTHYLYISSFYDGFITHIVLMFQIAFQWYGDNLHVFMRVRTKSHTFRDFVIVQYAQYTKIHSIRMMVIGKTKGMF